MTTPVPHAEIDEITDDATTRDRVLRLIVELGPISAAELARRLNLTSAAVRRHLTTLQGEGQVEARDDVPLAKRGRGRPARKYVGAASAHAQLGTAYAQAALAALAQIKNQLGEDGIEAFAEARSDEMIARYAPAMSEAGDDLSARAETLAHLLAADGYAATARPVPGGIAVQVCQGHCPVLHVAEAHHQLCEAETRAFSELLGVHVQRLATLASGKHVCTTHIPVKIPIRKDA
ncbi:helix-turn-helix transcriptional regulator [Pseudactinotalea suaedae]|jgi:predicted ArsR family transcriptional regulator|uniref:helix-turn-helix transcriptional regulator n=1 Tax=Pseudactinotalea suaedae TaxID=1524924 RepID=UPI0012E26331|nr:MarR family transcriptional regulator [Pseudactinotalea suaedae]